MASESHVTLYSTSCISSEISLEGCIRSSSALKRQRRATSTNRVSVCLPPGKSLLVTRPDALLHDPSAATATAIPPVALHSLWASSPNHHPAPSPYIPRPRTGRSAPVTPSLSALIRKSAALMICSILTQVRAMSAGEGCSASRLDCVTIRPGPNALT